MLTLLSWDETLLPRYMNLSNNFRGLPYNVEMATSSSKYTNSVLFAFTWKPVPPAACSRLWSRQCQRSWCPYQLKELLFLCFYIMALLIMCFIITVWVSLRRLYARSIYSIFLLCIEWNALEKSTNSFALRFFAFTPLMIQWIVRICEVVDQFLHKPFWFFLRIFLTSGLIKLRKRI